MTKNEAAAARRWWDDLGSTCARPECRAPELASGHATEGRVLRPSFGDLDYFSALPFAHAGTDFAPLAAPDPVPAAPAPVHTPKLTPTQARRARRKAKR